MCKVLVLKITKSDVDESRDLPRHKLNLKVSCYTSRHDHDHPTTAAAITTRRQDDEGGEGCRQREGGLQGAPQSFRFLVTILTAN